MINAHESSIRNEVLVLGDLNFKCLIILKNCPECIHTHTHTFTHREIWDLISHSFSNYLLSFYFCTVLNIRNGKMYKTVTFNVLMCSWMELEW